MITRDEINRILVLANENSFDNVVYGNDVESNGSVCSCSATAGKAITLEKLSEILEMVMSDSGRLIDEFVQLGLTNAVPKDVLDVALKRVYGINECYDGVFSLGEQERDGNR